jgi:hypothetical protein
MTQPDGGPVINQRFPVKQGNELSPPIVTPVGECAVAVHVSGFLPHAQVRVFANHTEQIGFKIPYFADDDIPLTRPLRPGDVITARQTVLGITSAESPDPFTVGSYATPLNKPIAGPDLYACGEVVPVNNLNPGTQVSVFRATTNQIGQASATQAWQPVVTTSLNASDSVTAVQTACRDIPAKKIVSPRSDPVRVNTDPMPVPPPTVEPFPVGADAVVLDGLFVGSAVGIFDNGSPAGSGLSTAGRNRAPLQPAAGSGAHVTATQKLCTASVPSPPQTPSSTLSAPVIVIPVCEGTHLVTLRNTYVNAIVVLFRNGTIAGMAGGEVGDLVMNLGGGATWQFGDQIRAVQYVGNVISPDSAVVFVGCANVITQHNDNSRTGGYTVETKLTPANVRPATFGRLYTRPVDGDIVGQPLYMRNVMLPAGRTKNLFFITTSKNNVYAFDADDLSSAAPAVWVRNLCSSVHSGVCSETYSGFVGVTSTPVIDPLTQTIYVVARCSDGSGSRQDGAISIYALNVATGGDRVMPVLINATAPGTNVAFNFHCQRNRPGLLLQDGVVYAAFATFSCDKGCGPKYGDPPPYHGWVLGYRESDLKQVAVFVTSPSNSGLGGGAGIWQTGKGLVGAPDGSIFFQTGNGPASEPLQDSFVKLSPTNAPGGLVATGHFTPNNAAVAIHPGIPGNQSLSDGDTDLGSGGPMILPEGRLIGGGKQGRFYVLYQSSMKLSQNAMPDGLGYDGFQAFTNTYHNDGSRVACPIKGSPAGCDPTGGASRDNRCYIAPVRYGDGELCGPNIHSGPVYWQPNASYGLIYEMSEKDSLKAFKYDLVGGQVSETPYLTATGPLAKPPTDGMPGGFSSVSSHGTQNGIVWTSLPIGDGQGNLVPGRLAAFDATSLNQIWSDDDNVPFAKSVPPTIADGKVIRAIGGFPGSVIVYGLLSSRGPGAPKKLITSIREKYDEYGGAASTLGRPTGDERPVGDSAGGRYQDYKGSVFGMSSTILSLNDRLGELMPTCSVPKGRTKVVLSSIYSSPNTGAHVVQGDIRRLWLKLGGAKGELGYPADDETYSPDHRGRMSRFLYGEIWWYPDKGAFVKSQRKP